MVEWYLDGFKFQLQVIRFQLTGYRFPVSSFRSNNLRIAGLLSLKIIMNAGYRTFTFHVCRFTIADAGHSHITKQTAIPIDNPNILMAEKLLFRKKLRQAILK
jgi:hypothetical protein